MKADVVYVKSTGHLLGAVARSGEKSPLEQLTGSAPLLRRYQDGQALDFSLPSPEIELASLEIELDEAAPALFAPHKFLVNDGALEIAPSATGYSLSASSGTWSISFTTASSEDRAYVIAVNARSGVPQAFTGTIPKNQASPFVTVHESTIGSVEVLLLVGGAAGVVLEL